jgi:SAM-dependent methyltransferase
VSEYTLTRAGDELTERERLALLQSYQDPPTFRYLTEAGVTTGWHCLDVGAGGGSITRWLADRVGPTGSVLATDIEMDLLSLLDLPNVTVQRHDVRTDPLPQGAFDLVHARLLLIHLPERDDVLARLIEAARPGGRIVLGDVDFSSVRLARHDRIWDKVVLALEAAVRQAGWDPAMGPKLLEMLEQHGIADVEAEGTCAYRRGGSVSPAIFSLTLRRLRSLILDQGTTTDELDHVHNLLRDPATGLHGPTLWTAWGTRT